MLRLQVDPKEGEGAPESRWRRAQELFLGRGGHGSHCADRAWRKHEAGLGWPHRILRKEKKESALVGRGGYRLPAAVARSEDRWHPS